MAAVVPKTPSVRSFLNTALQIRSYSAPADRSIPAAKRKYVPTSGTYPKGFLAGSAFAGVKASNTKYDDLALVVSEEPCTAAAVFTKNRFRAAPVNFSTRLLSDEARKDNDKYRGVIVNSGCANAVTGHDGYEHAITMAQEADKCFDPPFTPTAKARAQTLVMSTGVIGQQLPIERIKDAIPKLHQSLGSTHDHWLNAAQAICTTDTFPKLLSRTFTLPSHPETSYTIAGMTKGAGMIHPNMGTLLGIICTDVKIEGSTLRRLLTWGNTMSFNSISIDGDTSTNDTVAIFANGAAAPPNVEPLSEPERGERDFDATGLSEDVFAFKTVLDEFMKDLAQLVVRDGEGATKFVTIKVTSPESYQSAKKMAASIATSALVKTALYGKDANWGRILCAIGYAPISYEEEQIDVADQREVIPECTSVSFVPSDGSEELKLLTCGEPEQVDEERAKQILEMEDLTIKVRLDDGFEYGKGREPFHSTFWTCDFSHEYVTINGDYRT